MDKEESLKEYKENVKWLRKHVPLDDIYEFAEQAIVSSQYFLNKLHDHVDLVEMCKEDHTLERWILNVAGIEMLRQSDFSGILNVEIKDVI